MRDKCAHPFYVWLTNSYASSEPGSVVLAFLLNHSSTLRHIVSHLDNNKILSGIWKEKIGTFHETKTYFLNWQPFTSVVGGRKQQQIFSTISSYQNTPTKNSFLANCTHIAQTASGLWQSSACLECQGGKPGQHCCCCRRCAPAPEQYRYNWKQQSSVGKQCSDDGLNSAKWEWPLLVVDWGDKSSHRLRVLRAAICETMENQAASIIRYTLLTNPFRQFFSLS